MCVWVSQIRVSRACFFRSKLKWGILTYFNDKFQNNHIGCQKHQGQNFYCRLEKTVFLSLRTRNWNCTSNKSCVHKMLRRHYLMTYIKVHHINKCLSIHKQNQWSQKFTLNKKRYCDIWAPDWPSFLNHQTVLVYCAAWNVTEQNTPSRVFGDLGLESTGQVAWLGTRGPRKLSL